jgi:hypothetical protein
MALLPLSRLPSPVVALAPLWFVVVVAGASLAEATSLTHIVSH